eukprot:13825287-Heterocapsa_arctica.AAC.1
MNPLVSTREFATAVPVPAGADAEDAVEATFADGTSLEIIGFTCGDYLAKLVKSGMPTKRDGLI